MNKNFSLLYELLRVKGFANALQGVDIRNLYQQKYDIFLGVKRGWKLVTKKLGQQFCYIFLLEN